MSAAEVGSGVKQGDLLVSGVMSTDENCVRFVRAKAEVYANVNSKKEIKIPKSYNYFSLSENKINKKSLNFLWFTLPANLDFTAYPMSVSTNNQKDITVNGNALPIGITTQTTRELNKTDVEMTYEQTEKSFEKALLLSEVFENGDSTVKSRKIKITDDGEYYNCTCDYVFSQNIAQSVDFSVTDN